MRDSYDAAIELGGTWFFINTWSSASLARHSQITGVGSDKPRKEVMHRNFSDKFLFKTFYRKLQKRFAGLARDLERQVKDAVSMRVEIIQEELDMLKDGTGAQEDSSLLWSHVRRSR